MSASPSFEDALAAFSRGELDRVREIAEREAAAAGAADWQHLLGLVHCRSGKPELAIAPLRSAALAEPQNIRFRTMLVRALVDAGRAAEALEDEPPPSDAGAEAIPWWQARAQAARAAGDTAAMVGAFTAICRARPSAESWINLGRVQLSLADYAGAENAYREALAIDPTNADALGELGLAYHRTNRYDSLAHLLDEAAGAGVPDDLLAYLWALRSLREGDLARARAHLMKAPKAKDPARWNRLRARIADSAGDSAEAFAATEAMNASVPMRDAWLRRARAYRRQLRDLADSMTPAWAGAISPLPTDPRSSRVAFLVGFPRSGTTLLDTFLMGHGALTVLEEQPLLPAAAEVAGPLERLPDCSRETLERARDTYFERLDALGGGAGRIIDKFPLNLQSAPLIHALFREAPVIFAQRHPCDVVLSGFMRNFQPNLGMANFLTLEDAADFYDCVMTVWARSTELLPLRVHTVVYEELAADPESALRPLLSFLGLEWDPRVLDHRSTAKARGPVSTASFAQITQPVTTRSVGHWRRYATQMEPVLPVLLQWAERLGYRN